ncbi:MAG: four-carbon acid sugar kinase family protein, partial [Pseudomonadota bacterium]|nr:four-carbon acid sugar kinase family protein [Pseudomonadota bacterium]
MLLGCIADDFTGATDLANNLVRSGMRVVQTIGVPQVPLEGDVDAVVVALKSRTIEPEAAIAQSLAALRWLQRGGARQFYFKVCSTFDSTDRGNIGPVAEALMAALGTRFAIVCPAFPQAQRTVFKGYLFVGDVLLSESGMRDHPLTPMSDANLVRVLQRQSKSKVGLIDHAAVTAGASAIRTRAAELQAEGVALAIVDATSDADLMAMGLAFADLPLLVAGSGVAIGLAQNHAIAPGAAAAALPPATGAAAIVSGSCSSASNAQVQHFLGRGGEGYAIDPL